MEKGYKYESSMAHEYDMGDGKIGNHKKPVHGRKHAKRLYFELNHGSFYGFAYDIDSREVMQKLQEYNGFVDYSYSPDYCKNKIYRIIFL